MMNDVERYHLLVRIFPNFSPYFKKSGKESGDGIEFVSVELLKYDRMEKPHYDS